MTSFFSFFKRIEKFFPTLITVLVVVCGVMTYIGFAKYRPHQQMHPLFQALLYADVFLLLVLCTFVAKRSIELYHARKKQSVGSKLHVHLVLLFSLMTLTPTLCVATFSALFFNTSLKGWFSDPIHDAISEAEAAAKAYVKEQKQNVKQDAISVVLQIRPLVPALIHSPKEFEDIVTEVAQNLNLDEALVFDNQGKILARSYLTFALEFDKIPPDAFKSARNGEVVVLSSEKGERVRALVRLDPLTQTFLYVGKTLDKDVLRHYHKTNSAVDTYKQLESQRSHMQLSFLLFFALLTLLLLMAAIWLGMLLARQLISPIRHLITASQQVAEGRFDVQIKSLPVNNELDNLTQSFNAMTAQLDYQRTHLLNINKTLIQRRTFIEAVLSNISAGVIRMDQEGKIVLANRSAEMLFDASLEHSHLSEISPQLWQWIQGICQKKGEDSPLIESNPSPHSHQLKINRKGQQKILNICMAPVVFDDHTAHNDYIITLDDVSALIQAQRLSAWSDVARKIAHEIKNPLTPIQLSAERLRRRFSKEVNDEKGVFENCVQTIVRQVEHIKNLVGEFSSFARMPQPHKKPVSLLQIVRECIMLQQNAYSNLSINLHQNFSEAPIIVADAQQISQALTNILQNALNAMQEHHLTPLIIDISLTQMPNNPTLILTIDDHGPGFPKENRSQLLEPYVTTRSKGTGLGLAIVSKVIEDHGIQLSLDDAPLGGGRVTLTFQVFSKEPKGE
jgi:two-component system nitrogen regulation sensor histidine kinase NtrY